MENSMFVTYVELEINCKAMILLFNTI